MIKAIHKNASNVGRTFDFVFKLLYNHDGVENIMKESLLKNSHADSHKAKKKAVKKKTAKDLFKMNTVILNQIKHHKSPNKGNGNNQCISF